MSLDHDSRSPRFHIGDFDRITIEGEAFRLLERKDAAFVLMPAQGRGLARAFPFAHINQLIAAGKVRQEI